MERKTGTEIRGRTNGFASQDTWRILKRLRNLPSYVLLKDVLVFQEKGVRFDF